MVVKLFFINNSYLNFFVDISILSFQVVELQTSSDDWVKDDMQLTDLILYEFKVLFTSGPCL